jgi:hypothetical protein
MEGEQLCFAESDVAAGRGGRDDIIVVALRFAEAPLSPFVVLYHSKSLYLSLSLQVGPVWVVVGSRTNAKAGGIASGQCVVHAGGLWTGEQTTGTSRIIRRE